MTTRKTVTRPSPPRRKRTLREIYARLRKEFTAADLQKYAVIEKGVPLETVIAEMRKAHQEELQKLSRRKGKSA